MTIDIQPVPRPDWDPLLYEGCSGVDVGVLLHLKEYLVIAMLRFWLQATIHEQAADHDIDVICLEGQGMTSVGGEAASIHAGERVRWPKGVPHRLWTKRYSMLTLIVEHSRTRDERPQSRIVDLRKDRCIGCFITRTC